MIYWRGTERERERNTKNFEICGRIKVCVTKEEGIVVWKIRIRGIKKELCSGSVANHEVLSTPVGNEGKGERSEVRMPFEQYFLWRGITGIDNCQTIGGIMESIINGIRVDGGSHILVVRSCVLISRDGESQSGEARRFDQQCLMKREVLGAGILD